VAGPQEGSSAAVSFFGRDRELVRVASLLDEAQAGRGRLVLCTGEAGIGKTRFAEEIAAIALARGVAVVWARSTDRGSSPPYGLWRLALQELPRQRRDEPGPGPDLWSLVFGGSEGRALVSGLDVDRDQRFALFSEVRQRLARSAEPAGLLLVLDDVQWADEPSLLLLDHLVRQLRGTRMLIMVTCREPASPGDRSSEKIRLLAADASTERVELAGLQAGAIRELLASAGLAASREQADTVHAETGGNPFLVRELARMLAEPGATFGSVPSTVLDTTAYRVRQLSPGGQDVLRAAAVAGTSFSVGVVALMLDMAVLSLLDPAGECEAAGFFVAGDHPGDYRFSHALVRSAVVAQLSASDQLRLHNAAADAIERFHQGQLRSRLAELAHHRIRGSLPGDRIRAVRACEAAGDVAARDLAFEEATRLYREALSIGRGEISETDRGRLELAVGGALFRSGDLPGWHDAVIEVGRRAERRGDRLLLARTALAMEATGDAEWDSEICRLCEQALTGPELAGQLRARVLARHAQALVYRGEYERAGQVSQAALDAAELTSDLAALVDALHARQLACCAPEGVTERAALAPRMLDAASEVHSAWVEMWGRLWRIDTLFETGQLTAIARELADLAICVDRVHGPLARWHLLECSATLALATGRYTEAIRLAGDAFKVVSDMGHPMAFGSYAVILAQAGLHIGFEASGATGLFAQIPAHLAPAVADRSNGLVSVFPALSFALLSLQRGDRDTAARAYEQAGPVRSWNPVAGLRLSCWAHGLPVAIDLRKTGDIAYLASQFEPFRGQHVANGAGSGVFLGPVELQLGKAAAALGSVDAAVGDLEAAVAICDAIGAPGLAVESSAELAAVLVQRGTRADRDRALTILRAAGRSAERLGMLPFTRRIEDLRRRLSLIEPAPPVLSPREREVARLVGQGLTNRQIAAALYLSERTAQNHVQHILTKLGFSNRSQIAAWSSASAADPRPPGE
jgi:DNA-binding CsgD family transcriptional regulator